jgi:hypothetical protein
VFEKTKLADRASAHPAYRCRIRLKSRKGNGTIACWGMNPKQGAATLWRIFGQGAHGEGLIASIPVPERLEGWAMVNAADTPSRAGQGFPAWNACRQHARRNPDKGSKETNRTPNRTATPHTRNYGIACSRPSPGPVWRRSRHITQMPGVMLRTAAQGRTSTRIRPGDRTESASARGKDDAAKNGICSLRRPELWIERFC